MNNLNLDSLNEERLRRSVDTQIFDQGQLFVSAGKVTLVEINRDNATCIVHDKHPYRTEIKVARGYLYLKCDCRYAQRGIICEHEIAACLAVRNALQKKQTPTWRNQIAKLTDTSTSLKKSSQPTRYYLLFSLQSLPYYDVPTWKIIPIHLSYSAWLRFTGEDSSSITSAQFLEAISQDSQLRYHLRTNFNSLDPHGCLNCPPEGVFLANVLNQSNREYYEFSSRYSLADYLNLIGRLNCPLVLNFPGENSAKALNILDQPGQILLSISKDAAGVDIHPSIQLNDTNLSLSNQTETNLKIVTYSPLWILLDHYLFRLFDQNQRDLIQLFVDTPEITIPTEDEEIFLRRDYIKLARKFMLQGEPVIWQEIHSEPIKRLYLLERDGIIQAELRFAYQDFEVPFDSDIPKETILQAGESWTLVKIFRDKSFELKTFEDLASPSYGLKRLSVSDKLGMLGLRARVHPVDFLIKGVNRLIQNGFEIFGEEQLKTARVNRNRPTLSFRISSGIDWFDIHGIVNFGEIEVSLREVRRVVRKKERFIKLADGTIGEIPEDWLEKYQHLFALGEETSSGIRMASFHANLLDQTISHADSAEVDPQFTEYLQKLTNFTGLSPRSLPAGFEGELREYQKAGYNWLYFLHDYKFGGCLADDMGLGKTIQTLAFLQSLYENRANRPGKISSAPDPLDTNSQRKPSLLIAPRSLLVNWQREAARFVPFLRVLIYSEINRAKEIDTFDQYDLIITTYGILLRDIKALQAYAFNYAILDESQTVKNPLSQTARAVRLIKSEHRLVLTGTPIENSSVDLWSQFSFINPGLLGNLEYFKKEFIAPIEKKGDEQAAQTLRRIIHPFILRRTKDQVAPELPPRTEKILYCDMTSSQQKIYNRTRDFYRGVVLGMLAEEGNGPSRIKILEGLLRLRQISNHPKLVDENYRGESGKLELLLNTIDTLRSEGHKALIFSQFVQMLRILRKSLDDKLVPYLYLDGHTRNRMELVDEYQQNSSVPFFLISLKAGGQGLNLTAADYVIHIDPWWNPSVEMQASDRTHRIGQDKPVFIYKIITRDTVEEKIKLLQDKKKKLISQLIMTEGAFFKSLTTEDIQNLFS